ncbi:GPP34 family phosphoprotein [Streptomyces sp. NPDC006553]|uniref:GOLPH3/VPS74 family protein n=1 Tax=unclassified Streptomyces TaxID=2593676 RepID=UPI002257F56A|nr:GPP34 family phosphoprotein [Streptomyces sp. NBC_00233]MCX5230593.1 GPP34 family phosphoprotein [Streptomyces sp. NBC_00233]
MAVTLAEEIMLLSLDDVSGVAKERQTAAWAVAGGILLDLVLAGRLSVDDGRLRVTDATPTGVPLLDERMRQVDAWCAKKGRAPKVTEWLTKDHTKAVKATTESLRERGLVREERQRVMGLFPVSRYPEADGSVERELRARLHTVLATGPTHSARTTGLLALIHGARLHRLAFPDIPRKEVAARLEELTAGQWAAESVRRAIRDMQAAMLAITAATTVTIIS